MRAAGYLYRRETTDVKCEDADRVANLCRLRREGYVPECDVIVALREGEESDSADGVLGLLAHHLELSDAEVSGVFSDSDDVCTHVRDERLGVKGSFEGIEFMYRFMKAETSGP